ncbi:signal transduction histidine kinase [Agromyces terreus]|uniref:histidine kinase n=1 Tax=Agromyces terreus TaxID=424795 RepID=A0A9X2H3Z1_9MICO|nr:histidine kinase [Agromyces terreus]MCP2369634.1 signal transduction histidine kinase [Agromyces terreus]
MTSPVRSLWNAPAAVPPPPRRVPRDWVLVGVLVPLILVEAALRADVPWRWLWAVVLVALVPTLLWRRTRPFTMLAVAFSVGTAVGLVVGDDPQLFTTAYFLVLAYAVLRWGSGRAMLGGVALVGAGTLLSLVSQSPTPGDVIGGIAVVVAVCALGIAFRWRAGARARELERLRLVERERFARDLHDTVAHHVSAIAIQAQAGTSVIETDPDAAADVLRIIEVEASRTLDEMRSMVRVLRREGGPAELGPTPAASDVATLATAPGGAGPIVAVDVRGDTGALPPALGATVFRIAQEAVTNARRHARDSTRIDVRVEVDGERVRVVVRDDGAVEASAGPASAPRAGYGLTGMAERAALVGGTCTAGPAGRGEAGWVVAAVLPIDGLPIAGRDGVAS